MAAPMEDTFSLAVKRVLDSWTVLQLAVQHGFGGIDSAAKAEWMAQAVVQWLSDNANVELYEVEDFLADILDAEFNTVADDGSLPEVAKKVCEYYQMCKNGRLADVREAISRLPRADVSSSVAHRQEEEEEDDEEEDEIPPGAVPLQLHDGQASSRSTKESEETPMDMEEDDGWTVVRKVKKK